MSVMRVLSVLVVAALAIASTAAAETSDKAPVLPGLQTASNDTLPEGIVDDNTDSDLQATASRTPPSAPSRVPRPCRPEDRCRGRD
jgi:hypothetical protein